MQMTSNEAVNQEDEHQLHPSWTIAKPKPKWPLGAIWSPGDPLVDAWAKETQAWWNAHILYRKSNQTLLLRFAYPYQIDLDTIQSQSDLLRWVYHLSAKNWVTSELLNHLIEKVADIKSFNLHKPLR